MVLMTVKRYSLNNFIMVHVDCRTTGHRQVAASSSLAPRAAGRPRRKRAAERASSSSTSALDDVVAVYELQASRARGDDGHPSGGGGRGVVVGGLLDGDGLLGGGPALVDYEAALVQGLGNFLGAPAGEGQT